MISLGRRYSASYSLVKAQRDQTGGVGNEVREGQENGEMGRGLAVTVDMGVKGTQGAGLVF